MARLNIEDSIMEKAGFQKLMIKMGDRHKAMGVVWDLWRLAQKHWFPKKNLIPFKEFEEAELPDCLFDKAIGLAEKRDDGVYAKGSDEQFSWLFQLADAGKKSAEARRLKPKKSQKNETKPTTVERPLNEVERPLNASEGSSTSLLSSLNSSLSSLEKRENIPPSAGEDTAEFIGVYVKAFQKRYGKNSRPDLGGKVQGQIKSFVTEYGLDRSSMLIQVYLQMDDPWFLTKCYDFSTFLENRQKIGIALDTGKKDPSRKNHQSLAEYRAEQAQKLKELNQ